MISKRLWFYLIPSISFLILIALFVPGLGQYSFGIDDAQLFNQAFLKAPWTMDSLRVLLIPGYSPDYYPVRDLSVWLDWTFSDNLIADTTVPKIQNLLWLLGIFFLTYLLLVRITGQQLFSMLIACVWLLHPFHLESLHWISSRKDLMAWYFMLAAVTIGIRARRPVTNIMSLLIIILFSLSLLSKATFLAVPFALIAYFWWIRLVAKNHKKIWFSPIFLAGCAIVAILFMVVTFWNYTENNNMQISESFKVRILSVAAALGRNIIGIVLPSANGVDVEPWAGWYLYNVRFIAPGFLAIFLFLVTFIYSLIKRKTVNVLFCTLILSVLAMTPGFNPYHRNFYSIRYFEPVFYLLLIWVAIAVARSKNSVKIAAASFAIVMVGAIADADNWQTNLSILKKAHEISPVDPSPSGMLLTEYYNLQSANKLGPESLEEYRSLYKTVLEECIYAPEVNGRCVSYYKNARYYLKSSILNSGSPEEIRKRSFGRMIEAKKRIFSEIADSEVAWTVFHYKMDVDGVFDVEALRTYFADHKVQGDSYSRVVYIVYQCLEKGPKFSQALFSQFLAQKILQPNDARGFVADIGSISLREQAKTCFIKKN